MSGKRLFALNGYENTSTVAIAREAGTSESQLMKHFGSKQGLLVSIFDRGWETIALRVRLVPEDGDPSRRLSAVLEAIAIELEGDADLKDLMMLESRRVRKDGRDVLVSRGFQEFAAVVDSILSDMREQGQVGSDLNLEALRSALLGMVEGLLRDQVLARRSEFSANYTLEDVKKILDSMVPTAAHSHMPLKPVTP
jgi:AcrR family transcriptional regulator